MAPPGAYYCIGIKTWIAREYLVHYVLELAAGQVKGTSKIASISDWLLLAGPDRLH